MSVLTETERVHLTDMNIAIWGTGTFGRYIDQQLRKRINYCIRYFIDSNAALWGQEINGSEIISPKRLAEVSGEELDFVLVAFMNGIEIYQPLLEMHIIKFGIVWNRVFEAQMQLEDDLLQDRNIVWSDARYLDKPVLRSLETNIVDDCNLNCKGCSHFSNLFEHGAGVPFEVYCRDLKQVAEHVYIHQFNMLGGEAILHPRMIEYIEYTRKLLPNSDIEIISNGLLIPKQTEAFFRCCAENDITISISGYKPTLQIKDKIRTVLDKYHIAAIFREEVIEFRKCIDLSASADKRESVHKCYANRCNFLRYGKIYKCPFEALGNYFFEYFDLDIRLDGGIDIFDENMDWMALAERLARIYEPVDACRYCGDEKKIAWEVSMFPSLEDWVVRKAP